MKTLRVNNPFILEKPDYYKVTFENNGRRAVIAYFDNMKGLDQDSSFTLDDQEYYLRFEQAYDLDQLSALRGFSDAQVWQFADLGGGVVRPVALLELTVNRRSQPEVLNAVNGSLAGTSVLIPFADSPASDVTLVFNCNTKTIVEVTNGAEPVVSQHTRAYDLWFSLLPTMTLTLHSVTDGVHRVDVQVTAPNGVTLQPSEVHLELIGGLLLTPRVKTDASGFGSAYLTLQGLPTGYESRLKAGFKFATSLGEMAIIKD